MGSIIHVKLIWTNALTRLKRGCMERDKAVTRKRLVSILHAEHVHNQFSSASHIRLDKLDYTIGLPFHHCRSDSEHPLAAVADPGEVITDRFLMYTFNEFS